MMMLIYLSPRAWLSGYAPDGVPFSPLSRPQEKEIIRKGISYDYKREKVRSYGSKCYT